VSIGASYRTSEPKGAACKAFRGCFTKAAFPSGRSSRSTPMQSCAGAIRRRCRAELPSVDLLREGVGIAFGDAIPTLTLPTAKRPLKLRQFGK